MDIPADFRGKSNFRSLEQVTILGSKIWSDNLHFTDKSLRRHSLRQPKDNAFRVDSKLYRRCCILGLPQGLHQVDFGLLLGSWSLKTGLWRNIALGG